MKKRIVWITGTCFFDVDENIVPYLINRYEINWYVIRQQNSFYSKEDIESFIQRHGIQGEVLQIPRMFSLQALKVYYYIIKQINKDTDLIYVNFMGIPFLFPLLQICGIDKRKIIYPCHDFVDHVNIANRRLITIYKHYIFNSFKNFQFFSKTQQSLFLQKYSDKNTFFAPLALKGFGNSTIDEVRNGKLRFLFFGTIRKNKGLDILIKAINKLAKDYSADFELLIAGNTNDWNEYQRLIKNNNVIIQEIRRIENHEIPDLMTQADYLVLPYRDVTQSGPLLIAYYYALPVIASDHDGFKEYITDGWDGFLFKNEDDNDLYRVLKKTLVNRSEYKTIKNNLVRFVEENCETEKIISLYDSSFTEIIDKCTRK